MTPLIIQADQLAKLHAHHLVGIAGLGVGAGGNEAAEGVMHWSETCLGSGPDPVAGVDPCLGGVKLESMAWI